MFTVQLGAVVTEIIADGTQFVYGILSTKPEDLCDSNYPSGAGDESLSRRSALVLKPTAEVTRSQTEGHQ